MPVARQKQARTSLADIPEGLAERDSHGNHGIAERRVYGAMLPQNRAAERESPCPTRGSDRAATDKNSDTSWTNWPRDTEGGEHRISPS